MEARARHTMRLPVPILERPGLGALGAASGPVASNIMAEVPRRKTPSVESEVVVMNGFVDSAATFRVIEQVAETPASVIKQHRTVATGRRAIPASVSARVVVASVQ
jgi:hypothetical protein